MLELGFVGMAIRGMPVNISSRFLLSSGGAFVGLVLAGLPGITNQFPEAKALILNQLKENGPFNRTGSLSLLNMPEEEALVTYVGLETFNYFTRNEAIM